MIINHSNLRTAILAAFFAVAVATTVAGLFSGCAESAVSENTVDALQPVAFDTWARNARIGGASVSTTMTQAQVDQVMSTLAAQNVSVVEADFDNGLSFYRTDAEFDQFLPAMQQLATTAHNHGLKVVLYYASLESETPNGVNLTHTMYKDHPDWVQRGLDGTPNVVYGGSATVTWIDPGEEDAWMSPSSPYRDYYINRVKKVAATGVDGIWVDVPLYAAWNGVLWNDTSTYASTKFSSATGYQAPTIEDWTSPAWRRWIAWRHQELTNFIADVANAAHSQNPELAVVVETLPTDYTGATIWGLEGADLGSIEGVMSVWEVTPISGNTGMRNAREDDWISYISVQKYIRAASGDRPSWSFAYASQANDAELCAGEILAARNNLYELKLESMTVSVDPAYRTKIFNWIKSNEAYLHQSTPAARVAVLYSQASRDYVDKFAGLGQFVTTNTSDDLWWESDPSGSAYNLQYVADYRGMVKLMVNNHVPFDVVVKPASAQDLAKYQAVLLPDWEAASDADAQIIKDYVTNGGHIIVTGPNPGGWDQYGSSRLEYALSDVLGISKASSLPSSKVNSYGAGEARFFSDLLGKKVYAKTSDATAAATLLAAVNATSTPWLTTDANEKVHMDLSQTSDTLVLQYVNFIGLNGSFTVTPTSALTTLKIPAGKEAIAVELTSPDNATPAFSALAFTKSGQDVTFTVPITEYSMVLVSLQNTGTVTNHPPVANADSLSTTQGVLLAFTAAQLLSNDSDPDGDALTIAVASSSTKGVSITNLGSGNYTYAAPTFSGTDTFTYTLSDGKGGTATGMVTVTVSAPPVNHPPVANADSLSTTQGVQLAFTAAQLLSNDSDPDGDALTISVASSSTKGVTINNIGGGSYTYAAPTFTGTDTFTYTLSDGKGGTATGTVTVTVSAALPTNHPPVANADSLSTTQGVQLAFTAAQLLSNDSDPDGDALTITVASTSTKGVTITNLGSGNYTYAAPTFTGTDTFTYTLSDGKGGTATGTVTVTVNAATLTSATYYPTGVIIQTGTFNYGSLASFKTEDSDTYDILSAYVAADGGGETDWYAKTTMSGAPTAVTQITVTYKSQFSQTNVAQQFYLYNFTKSQWDLFDTRTVGNTVDVTVTATVSANASDYVSKSPAGELRARVKGVRAGAQSTTAVSFYSWANFLSWDIKTGSAPPVNHPPVANADSLSTTQGIALTFTATQLLSNDSDPDGDALTITVASTSTKGVTITNNGGGSYTYAAPTFTGTDTFTYTLSDGKGGTATGSVTVTVAAPTNHPPVANADSLSTTQGVQLAFTAAQLLSNDSDPDGDALTISVASSSTKGVSITNLGSGKYTYAAPGFTGTDTFTYALSDGKGGTATGTVTVTVSAAPPTNHPPVANADSLSTTQGIALTFTAAQLLSNDSDPDGDALTITVASTSTKGVTITNLGSGNYTYAAPTFTGSDTFTYTLSDGKGGTATGTVTVTVSAPPVNHPPVANADSLSTTQGVQLAFTAAQLLSNDSDPDGDALTISVASSSTKGVSITNLGSGKYTYAAPGFTGTDTFTYALSDGKGGTATGTVTVTVNAATLTPATYYPTGVILQTGTFDYGSLASFKTEDSDTYDILSAYVAADGGGVTDWYAKTTMSGAPAAVTQITVTYKGQFSQTNVAQQFYLYNFTKSQWDLFDTRTVGNTVDVTVTATVSANASDYVSKSPAGELRARVKGVRAGAQSTTAVAFYSWANFMSWAIK